MDTINERIKFSYLFHDDDTEHEVNYLKHGEGLCASDICEMFVDFMVSAGFSEKNVWDYFKED